LENVCQLEPVITMLHLPEELLSWSPCVNMKGDETWTEIQAANSGNDDHILAGDNDEMFDITIPGPPQTAGDPKQRTVSYGIGVQRKRGIAPFQRTTYLTLLPKYTFVNDTGLSLQISQGNKTTGFQKQMYLEVRDGCSMSTLGLFCEDSADHSTEPDLRKTHSIADKVRKVRVRLVEEGGNPRTRWSLEFGIDEMRSVPLRLLHHCVDLAGAVEEACHCVVTTSQWGAATFVEIRNVTFIEPMYQIRNSCIESKRRMRIWQPEPDSPHGRKGAMQIEPGQAVAFSFDNPDAGSMVEFEVDGSGAQQINAKHPSQEGVLLSARGQSVRYRTSISGYTRKLEIYESSQGRDADGDAAAGDSKRAEMKVEIRIPKIGISIVSADRHEIMYASICKVAFHRKVTQAAAETNITIDKMQVDNQTDSGQPVVMMAGDVGKFIEITLKENLQVTAMPYYDDVQVSLARFTLRFHEVWLRRLLHFEHDAKLDNQDLDVALEVSNTVKYRRRALIGVTKAHMRKRTLFFFLFF